VRVYLDNNATTMVDPEAFELMKPFFCEKYGNPNSLHKFGSETHPALRRAMDQLYAGINASDNDDIVVTSCATESNNWVAKGVFFDHILNKEKDHVVISAVEHPAIAATFESLKKYGVRVSYVPVNENGLLDPNDLRKLTDATQTVGKIKINVREMGMDFMSFSAHKFHGPKGVGGLYIKDSQKLTSLLHGGEHMGGRRSGTLDVAGIVGMAQALENSNKLIEFENLHVRRLRDKLEDALLQIPDISVVGDRAHRLPNTIPAAVKGGRGEVNSKPGGY